MQEDYYNYKFEAGFPISCVCVTAENEIVFGGGGGAGRSGVKNKFALYKLDKKQKKLKSVTEFVLSSKEDAPTCIAAHPTASIIASSINSEKEQVEAGENKNFRVFKLTKKNVHPGKKTQTIHSRNDIDYQKAIVFDPNGKHIACASTDGSLAVVEYPSLKPAFPYVEAGEEVNDVDFNSSGKWLVAATDKELHVLSVNNGATVQTIEKPHTASGEVAVFRACRFGRGDEKLGQINGSSSVDLEMKDVLYTALNTKSRKQAYVAMWNTKEWKRIVTRPVCQSAITTFALSNNGELLAFATANLQICICSASTLRVLARIKASHSFAITALTFDKDDKYLISGSADESCQLLDLPEQWPSPSDNLVRLAKEYYQLIAIITVLILALILANISGK